MTCLEVIDDGVSRSRGFIWCTIASIDDVELAILQDLLEVLLFSFVASEPIHFYEFNLGKIKCLRRVQQKLFDDSLEHSLDVAPVRSGENTRPLTFWFFAIEVIIDRGQPSKVIVGMREDVNIFHTL